MATGALDGSNSGQPIDLAILFGMGRHQFLGVL